MLARWHVVFMGDTKTPRLRMGQEIERLALRVSVRFNYILFPLDFQAFSKALASRDFEIGGELPKEPLGIPPGGSLGGQGVIASKGDLRADINTDKQFFGVAGQANPKIVAAELKSILDSLSGVVDSSRIELFELQARYRLQTERNVFSAIKNAGKKARLVQEATKAFASPMDLFSAQLVAGGMGPNSADYLEVWLQPGLALPDTTLGVGVIMRKPNFKELETAAARLENDLAKYLTALLSAEP